MESKWWNARSGILAPLGLPPHLHLSWSPHRLRERGSEGAEHGAALLVASRRGCGTPLPSYGVAEVVPRHVRPVGDVRLDTLLRAVQGALHPT